MRAFEPPGPARADDHQALLVKEPFLTHLAILSAMRMHKTSERVQIEGCGALVNLAFNGTRSPRHPPARRVGAA